MRPRIEYARTVKVAREVLAKYPPEWQKVQGHRIPQFAKEISLIYKSGGTVVDLGGGDGLRSAICVGLGMKAYNVDAYRVLAADGDYMHQGFKEQWDAAVETGRKIGVEFVNQDVLGWRTNLPQVDVVMSFDSMEHWQNSPRALFKHLVEKLPHGGMLFIGVPNAANISKRLRVLMGRNVFSTMDDWYYTQSFAGHVREPVVADLRVIARDLDLKAEVFGGNWIGLHQLRGLGPVAGVADRMLRTFPSLCSDIYLLGEKR
ncbi:class I SAM-dependent methyltransferase [Rhodomicrobium lacus]|uniref:class I SAM-dependent methyltransferase n=1 Tax=Rhodomicrobium lacus TaxID=2498452 RepID=UPI000F8F2B1B|nr:methyltransferase domain-containing protein [Rhodomicrobium lacus]